jgi:hypothetical protein
MLRLFFTQGKTIAAQPELNRVAQRRSPDHLYVSAAGEAHFQQAPAKIDIAADGDDAAAATDAKLIQPAGARAAAMPAGEIAGLWLHVSEV